jgi:hypothetical protein
MRDFLLSVILCNNNYIKEYESLMKKDNINNSMEELTESFNEEKDIIIHVYRDFDNSFMTFYNDANRLEYEPEMMKNKYTSFNLGVKYKLHFLHGDKKELSKFSKDNIKTFSMKNINNINNTKEERNDSKTGQGKENNYSKFSNNLIGSFYSDEDEKDNNNANIIKHHNQNKDNKNENENSNNNNIIINTFIINEEDNKGFSRVNTLKDSTNENDENKSRCT